MRSFGSPVPRAKSGPPTPTGQNSTNGRSPPGVRFAEAAVACWIWQLTRTDSFESLFKLVYAIGRGNDPRTRFARRAHRDTRRARRARRAHLLLASLPPCTFVRFRVRRGRRAARHTPLPLECAGVPLLHQVKLRHHPHDASEGGCPPAVWCKGNAALAVRIHRGYTAGALRWLCGYTAVIAVRMHCGSCAGTLR